jgi:hypothetical protein
MLHNHQSTGVYSVDVGNQKTAQKAMRSRICSVKLVSLLRASKYIYLLIFKALKNVQASVNYINFSSFAPTSIFDCDQRRVRTDISLNRVPLKVCDERSTLFCDSTQRTLVVCYRRFGTCHGYYACLKRQCLAQ